MPLKSILVLGLGKVGTLVGVLLNKTGFHVVGAARSEKAGLPFETKKIDVSDMSQVVELMKAHDAVVSCLPYQFNLDIATGAPQSNTLF